jgi:hypothetical protein
LIGVTHARVRRVASLSTAGPGAAAVVSTGPAVVGGGLGKALVATGAGVVVLPQFYEAVAAPPVERLVVAKAAAGCIDDRASCSATHQTGKLVGDGGWRGLPSRSAHWIPG